MRSRSRSSAEAVVERGTGCAATVRRHRRRVRARESTAGSATSAASLAATLRGEVGRDARGGEARRVAATASATGADDELGQRARPPRARRRGSARPSGRARAARRGAPANAPTRSTSRRTSRNISSCTAAGHDAGRARRPRPTCRPRRTRRARSTCARASTGSDSPVSSHRRDRKLMPARLTTALATTVATISRRSGCAASASSNPVAQRRREVRDEGRPRGTDRRGRRTRPARAAARASCTRAAPRAPARSSPSPAAWRSCSAFALGQRLERAVEPGGLLEPLHLAGVHARPARAPRPTAISSAFAWASLSASTRSATASVISTQQRRRARRPRARPSAIAALQEDLDVHLVVGAVDAGRVVDGVGVDASTRERVLHPGRAA